jgi:hypothetical protein
VHDRASDVFLPRENNELIANGDCLIFDSIGEADVITGHDFHGQLAFGVESNTRREGREFDLKHLADAKR